MGGGGFVSFVFIQKQSYLLNLCSGVVNSLRVFCSQKAGVKIFPIKVLWYEKVIKKQEVFVYCKQTLQIQENLYYFLCLGK